MRFARTALLVAPLIALAVAAPAGAQTIPATGVGSAKVVPLQVTGPAANRFNLVIAGDGYTEAELPKFRQQVDKHLNIMWSIEPYKSYRNYINVYMIEIISGESGIDCDPNLTSPRKDTPLSMGFWGGCNASSVQRLVTVNNTALSRYTALAPGVSQRLAIGNSDTYGGAGGTYATATGGNALSALISPHEIGHSLGGLQDEYDYYTRGVLGGCYTGGEPSSAHHTLLTVDQMLTQQKKWWRWLGEPSEAGGLIDRFEGGLYFDRCVWRPSKHSIMKSLGYYYDQPSREIMTRQISSRVKLVDGSTPTTGQVGNTDTLWVETQHPVDHELNVTWSLDGTAVPNSANYRTLKLGSLALTPGTTHTVTAKVVDPTTFVRDPAIQNGTALTQTLTWTVKDAANAPGAAEPATITSGTPNERAIGRHDVVYVVTSKPADGSVPAVTWKLDGNTVAAPNDGRTLKLAGLNLANGTHTLTATTGDSTRTWEIDATDAVTTYTVSTPKAIVSPAGAEVPEYIFEGPFSMKLTAHRRQGGLRRARVPRRRRRLAELLRLADRRQRAVPVLRHGHRHRRAQLRQAALRPPHDRVPRDRRRRQHRDGEEVRRQLHRPGEVRGRDGRRRGAGDALAHARRHAGRRSARSRRAWRRTTRPSRPPTWSPRPATPR